MTMSHRSLSDVINADQYGLEAAAAKDSFIDSFLFGTEPADIIKSLAAADQIPQENMRYLARGAIIDYSATGDREAAAEPIKRQEYLAAYYRLGKLLRMYRLRHDQVIENPTPPQSNIDDSPAYLELKSHDDDYQSATESITENLYETVQASNAPSAAISAAGRSI